MFRKSLVGLVFTVFLFGSVAATPAFAVELEGSGTVHAEGSGVATIQGHGQVWAGGCPASAVACTLAVHDNANPGENPVVRIQGYGWMQKRGDWYIYHGFDGSALVAGEDITVRLAGHHISLTASGTGQATLRGRGTYSVNGGPILYWPATVKFGS